jgi:hypothetical protein
LKVAPLSQPTYTNTELQQRIEQNKNKLIACFNEKNLNDQDMELIGYYLLQNNTVINILFLKINSKHINSLFSSFKINLFIFIVFFSTDSYLSLPLQ